MNLKETNTNFDFWRRRSERYNKLDWAKHQVYLEEFVKAGMFTKNDVVLDVGTGTGIVAQAVAPLVKEVIGIDESQHMLDHSNLNGNMYFFRGDIRDSIFKDQVFNKVTARLVFHHILTDTQKAMNECYRVLKSGGHMIFSEGVPPSLDVKQDYIEIFKLKEKRLTFMEDDLVALMDCAGFKNIKMNLVLLKEMSVRNWLENSGLQQSVQDKIFEYHANAGEYFKMAYDMVETDGDILINMKMAILTGEK